MFWIWANEPTAEDEAMIYGVPKVIEQQDLSFNQGKIVSDPVPPIEISRDSDSQGTLTDNLIAPGSRGLLFSMRLRKLLGEIGVDNIQYFPVRVTNPADSTSTDDYMLANLLGRIACIDMAKSTLHMHPRFPDVIEFFDSLVLDESKIKDLLMFRVEGFSPLIVVHEKIKEACEGNGITGIVFYEPEDYTL